MGPQAAPLLSPCVFVYLRGAQKQNAGLGHVQASLAATLNLRICAIIGPSGHNAKHYGSDIGMQTPLHLSP